jgi:hypothetical protein
MLSILAQLGEVLRFESRALFFGIVDLAQLRTALAWADRGEGEIVSFLPVAEGRVPLICTGLIPGVCLKAMADENGIIRGDCLLEAASRRFLEDVVIASPGWQRAVARTAALFDGIPAT